MSYEYDNYIKEHKENVQKGFDWLHENLPEAVEYYYEILPLITSHDESKYTSEEYDAYDKYFYGGNRSYAVVQAFKYAWLHHIHHNPHHWQYWVLHNDEPGEGLNVLDMPYKYIVEMICDWWAFSWKKGDLTEIFNWYDDHKDYMKLSSGTRKIVEQILKDIKAKLEEISDDQN